MRITTRRGISATIEPEAAETAFTHPQPPILNGTAGGLSWQENSPAYLPIVPGASGFGMNTTAASGRHSVVGSLAAAPMIYPVINTNRTGLGSFPAALQASGDRIIIFNTSGLLDYSGQSDLNRQVIMGPGRVIIAGQTAPDPGFVTFGLQIVLNVETNKDSLISHLTMYQYPYEDHTIQAARGDCFNHFHPAASSAQQDSNIVHANCWYSWASDELVDLFYGTHKFSFWQCMFAESLANTDNGDGVIHSYGPLIGRDRTTALGDYTRCAYVHNQARNPLTRGDNIAILNGLWFDCSNRGIQLSAEDGAATHTDIEGNIFITGPTGFPSRPIFRQDSGANIMAASSTVYLAGNRAMGWSDATQSGLIDQAPGTLVSSRISASYPSGYNVTQITNEAEFARLVMRHVGSRPGSRLSLQTRVMDHIEARLTGSGSQGGAVAHPDDIGMPSIAQNTVNHTSGADPLPGLSSLTSAALLGVAGRSIMPSGYTALEEWLHRRTAEVMP